MQLAHRPLAHCWVTEYESGVSARCQGMSGMTRWPSVIHPHTLELESSVCAMTSPILAVPIIVLRQREPMVPLAHFPDGTY